MITEVGQVAFSSTDIGLFGNFVAVTWGRALLEAVPTAHTLRGVSLPLTDGKGPVETVWAPRVGQAWGEVYKIH